MLSKCANPECSTPFQYLRDGKLFLVEVDDNAASSPARPYGPQLIAARKGQRKVEHFWLCGRCIETMTLAVEPGRGVVTVPRAAPQVRRTAAG